MSAATDYQSCLNAMFALHRFGIKLGLETIGQILAALGQPHQAYHTIHVAGTNGKGSVAASLAAILQAAGRRVGLYTSPHLVRFNERIQVNGVPIADDRVVEAYHAIQAVDRVDRELTFFELATAMAFFEFAWQGVEWAVIETGMGGRLDATNIIQPVLSVITNVSLEHQAYLGRSIARIASEKGGIIKPGVAVVTAVRQPSAIAALRDIARQRQAPLFRRGEHFHTRREKTGRFTYFGMQATWRHLELGLHGAHQLENASLALAGCELLRRSSRVELTAEQIAAGLTATHWPGRLEIIRRHPLVILDGAHNLAAMSVLRDFLCRELQGRPLTLVIGILDDKPHERMLRLLLPLCQRVIVTRPRIERALPPQALERIVRNYPCHVDTRPDVATAIATALERATRDEVLLIAGSLYVVGEAKEYFASHPPSTDQGGR
jgi:dihydrofolate synthase/folylpolyglutamate synthase